jgi:hypothetical protein
MLTASSGASPSPKTDPRRSFVIGSGRELLAVYDRRAGGFENVAALLTTAALRKRGCGSPILKARVDAEFVVHGDERCIPVRRR